MKRMLQLLLALSILSIFLISPVAAANSQGLVWGVAVDDEFVYRFSMVDEGETTFDERFNVTVVTTPAIPTTLSDWYDIPGCSATSVLYNGSALTPEFFILIAMMVVGGYWIVPTGNYSLLGELANATIWWGNNHTFISDSSYWGIKLSTVSAGITGSLTLQYLKADGVLSHFLIQSTNSTSGLTSTYSFVREGLGFNIVGFLTDNILYIGIGIGVLIVLAVVCKRR